MAALTVPAAAEPDLCPDIGTPAKVMAVADDLSLVLDDGRIVRLAGIDLPTPPLGSPDDQAWPLAVAATAALRDAVSGGGLTLSAAGAADRHGRLPAYLHLSGRGSVQDVLLRQGLARARWLPGETVCFRDFLAAEAAARNSAIGLWASPEYATRVADEPSLALRNGLYELVEGRVVSVGHGARMIFLDFGSNVRRDFTVMIVPRVAEGLASLGLPPDGLAGRRVRVRGVLEESGGPAIRLNDPAEIEVLD